MWCSRRCRSSQTGVDLGLVVAQADLQRTRAVLKENLGLFPEPGELHKSAGEALAVLSMYERGDALVAARALGEAGMTYLWRDGSDHVGELPDGETVAIEVKASEVERAAQLVETRSRRCSAWSWTGNQQDR